ncbi:hypothetical protein [Nitrosomonas cryotolerans]|uniref:hypothetical protein n=1 Tax=Nitrosomonas cryotolerans TaxID=44575 RepID=UPI00068769A7|nr:hypothetical protein [Nitrosomonas cryotolerans]
MPDILNQRSRGHIFIFTDLDDTLIQTQHKVPANARTELGATDRLGQPLSYFTQSQKLMLDMFANIGAQIIPVTGRNTEALNRVEYDFQGLRVVSHGAVILTRDNRICQDWLSEIAPLLQDWPDLLTRCNAEVNDIIKTQKLDARSRVIIDQDIPAYISIKGETADLAQIRQLNTLDSQFACHENGRNIALLAPYASKKKAVEFIKKQLELSVNDLVIGIGDSLSDLAFMSSCQFSMLPSNSQIARELIHA